MTTAHASQVTPRRGFTLIELLMVILLVGILASLLLVAINSALKAAQNAAVQSEIDQMATAIETYKGNNGAYPPSLGATLHDANIVSFPRDQRMMRHVAKAFPRYVGNATQLAQDISDGTLYHPLATPQPNPTVGLQWGDLDPAESLVFWLGGFPDPNSETKLIGFRSDPANPFRYPPSADPDAYLRNRTTPAFAFNPQRLVDRDQDGWWEYIQDGKAEGDMPPYVYFDPTTYNLRPFYPQSDMPSANTVNWGHAIPYATSDTQRQFASASPNPRILWANSQKFQIVAPGRDGSYGRQLQFTSPATVWDPNAAAMNAINSETRLWPTCTLLRLAGVKVSLCPISNSTIAPTSPPAIWETNGNDRADDR